MATSPFNPQSQPEGAAPGQGAAPAASPMQQQANPLQTALAQLAKICEQMAQQNPVVQGEMQQARSAFVQALQKTMMAGRPQQAESTPPPQQG